MIDFKNFEFIKLKISSGALENELTPIYFFKRLIL